MKCTVEVFDDKSFEFMHHSGKFSKWSVHIMKYYLVTAEFLSGEFGQYFYHAFKTRDNADIDKRVDDYFTRYYGDKRLCEKDGDRYYYHSGMVAVKVEGSQEITKEEYEVFAKFSMAS